MNFASITNFLKELEEEQQYELLGAGLCYQADGIRPLRFRVTFDDLSPHTDGNNTFQAKLKCMMLCSKYSWCFAIQLALPLSTLKLSPSCHLITDRPNFEIAYGHEQNYTNYHPKRIDGITFETFCRANGCKEGDKEGSNWGGGKLFPQKDMFCYKKKDSRAGNFISHYITIYNR